VKKRFTYSHLILGTIILISIVGGAIVTYTTAKGPWGYTDPVEYISTARSLDNGLGFGYYGPSAVFVPITYHPPFYSIVLSALGLFGINLIVGARWFNIIAFVMSIFISGWIFFRFSRVPAMGIIASALMCAFPYMVEMYSSAYSEPLFILLFLFGGLCLFYYLDKEKPIFLLPSALLFGLIPVTRYIGIAMVIAAGLSIILFSSEKPWLRGKKAALFVFVASVPALFWLVRVYLSAFHSIAGRTIGLNWGELAAKFQTFRGVFLDMVWEWVPFQSNETLLRYMVRLILTVIVAVVILALSLLAERRLHKDSAGETNKKDIQIFTFFGLSSLLFLAVLIVTYLIATPTLTMDNRMLLPFFVSTLMTLFGGFALWQSAWFKGGMRMLQILPWLIAVIGVVWYFPLTEDQVKAHHSGQSYTSYHWNKSELIQAVRILPPGKPVISNEWELLLLWIGRPIHDFWDTFPSAAPIHLTMYGTDQRDHTQSIFCTEGAALVIFNDFPSDFRLFIGERYLNQLPNLFDGLAVYGVYPDGIIYLCP
jgi:hypothetical protein